MLGAIAFAAIRFLFTLWYLGREYGAQELAFDWPKLRTQLAYTLPFELAIVVEILQTNYHQYAVSAHFGAVAFAVYAVGCLQLPFVDFVAGPACNVMMVRMAEEIAEGSHRQVLAIWRDTTRKLALVFIPLFALLVVASRDMILLLFTERYAAAVPIFILWAAVVPLAVFQTDGLLRVYAQTRFIFFMNIVRLAMIAGLIGSFLSFFGLRGAVLISLLATVVAKAGAMVRGLRLMQAKASEILPWGSLVAVSAASTAAVLPAWIVKTEMPWPLLPKLLLMGVVFSIAYVGLVLGFDLVNESEKEAVAGWLRRPAVKPEVLRGRICAESQE